MSSTLLRSGLYLLVIVFALFVVDTVFINSPFNDFVSADMLQKAMGLAVLLTIAGMVLLVMEKASRKLVKSRCQVCRTEVPPGAIYCRQHLRSVLADEDDVTHHARPRR